MTAMCIAIPPRWAHEGTRKRYEKWAVCEVTNLQRAASANGWRCWDARGKRHIETGKGVIYSWKI